MDGRVSLDPDEETAGSSDLDALLLEKEAFEAKQSFRSSSFHGKYSSLRLSCNPSPLLRTWAYALIPSFLKSSTRSSAPKSSNTNSIAALDGLRGLACFFVFNEHLTYNISTSFLFGYGVGDRRTVIQYPFIRIFWSGFSMVAIFYVISGYVLSYKPLQQIQNRDVASFQATLTSSVVRRAMRLYLPTTIAVLICGLLVSLGAFDYSSSIFQKDGNYLHLHEIPPPMHEIFILQMTDTLKHALQMLNFWNWSDDLSAGDYDRHLWTVSVEFRSSMVLFLFLLSVSRLKQTYRFLFTISMIIFCILTERKDVLLFVSGMLLADLDLIRHSKSLTPPVSQYKSVRLPSTKTAWLLTFIIGLYFSSVPTIGCDDTPGYRIISSLVPSCWSDKAAFLRSIGAVLITWSAANSDFLSLIFTNKPALYLGKISYALYLVHGNVLKSLGYAVMPTIYRLTNDGTRENITTSGMVVAWMLSALITVPVTFWLSDLFWRGVDVPCVTFARWVERKISEDFEDQGRDRGREKL